MLLLQALYKYATFTYLLRCLRSTSSLQSALNKRVWWIREDRLNPVVCLCVSLSVCLCPCVYVCLCPYCFVSTATVRWSIVSSYCLTFGRPFCSVFLSLYSKETLEMMEDNGPSNGRLETSWQLRRLLPVMWDFAASMHLLWSLTLLTFNATHPRHSFPLMSYPSLWSHLTTQTKSN